MGIDCYGRSGMYEILTDVGMNILFLHENFGLIQAYGMSILLLAVSIVMLANSQEGFGKLIPLKAKKMVRYW